MRLPSSLSALSAAGQGDLSANNETAQDPQRETSPHCLSNIRTPERTLPSLHPTQKRRKESAAAASGSRRGATSRPEVDAEGLAAALPEVVTSRRAQAHSRNYVSWEFTLYRIKISVSGKTLAWNSKMKIPKSKT